MIIISPGSLSACLGLFLINWFFHRKDFLVYLWVNESNDFIMNSSDALIWKHFLNIYKQDLLNIKPFHEGSRKLEIRPRKATICMYRYVTSFIYSTNIRCGFRIPHCGSISRTYPGDSPLVGPSVRKSYFQISILSVSLRPHKASR